MSTGIVVVSIGEMWLQSLWNCLNSIHRHASNLNVHVISDNPIDEPMTLVRSRIMKESRFYKTQLHNLSPFDLTLFLDHDTVIHRPLPDLESVLGGDADIAMSLTPEATIANVCIETESKWILQAEKSVTVKECSLNTPFFNSGVMLFRKTQRTRELFDKWHQEWLRFQDVDQVALSRAIHKTGIQPMELDSRLWNCRTDWYNRETENPYIFHFADMEDEDWYHIHYASHADPPDVYLKYKNAELNGLCSRNQYLLISKLIVAKRPCRLLIFGCREDSEFWHTLNAEGKTTFIEHNESWYNKFKDKVQVMLFNYHSRRGEPCEIPPVPEGISDSWDIILIDGPEGYSCNAPGREIPIAWASQMKEAVVIIHDYARPWEYHCCSKYLGIPDFVSDLARPDALAFWRLSPEDKKVLLL